MINPIFYNTDKLIQKYLNQKVKHYPRKDRTTVLEKRPYVVKSGDTYYSIAAKLFGEDGEYNWTIIADINYLRKPDELQVGETIWLPKVVLGETNTRLPTYENKASTATAL
jgi:LysM repeat protein